MGSFVEVSPTEPKNVYVSLTTELHRIKEMTLFSSQYQGLMGDAVPSTHGFIMADILMLNPYIASMQYMEINFLADDFIISALALAL